MLGNEAMQSGDDVAAALIVLARGLRAGVGADVLGASDASLQIRDLNGNTVGGAAVTKT